MVDRPNPSAQGLGAFFKFALSGEIKNFENYIRKSAGSHHFYDKVGEAPLFAKMIKAFGYPETFDSLVHVDIKHTHKSIRRATLSTVIHPDKSGKGQ